jgi:hypothetical protein
LQKDKPTEPSCPIENTCMQIFKVIFDVTHRHSNPCPVRLVQAFVPGIFFQRDLLESVVKNRQLFFYHLKDVSSQSSLSAHI